MIILQAAQGSNFLFIIVLFAIMFLFMIYPQIKRQKKERKFFEAMKKGDKVIMKSGLHGKIVELTPNSVVIETLAGKLKFERSAVSLEYSQRLNAEESK